MNEQPVSDSTILIVDDNPDNLSVLNSALAGQGYRVLSKKSGEDAIRTAEKRNPDLILLDILMPGIDGFETCRRLKQDDRLKEIPVIFMSALSDTVDKIRGFEIGGVDYVTKPFQQEELHARINTHLTIRKLQEELRSRNELLQEMVSLDGLTGIANRRRFDEVLERELKRHTRDRLPLSLILCDIDYFKLYNDTYGHQEGDHCLKKVAACLKKAANRETDLAARYGGEEFVLICSNTDADGAAIVADNIRQHLEDTGIEHRASKVCGTVTISMGIRTAAPEEALSPESIIREADEALYEAKKSGRNCFRTKKTG